MLIYKEKSVTVDYDQDHKQIMQKWIGFPSSEEFRNAIEKTIEFAQSNPVHSIISDTQEQRIVKKEDIEFAALTMPELVSTGLKAIAFILPKNAFGKSSLNKFDQESKLDLINFFTSVDEAQQWIETVG